MSRTCSWQTPKRRERCYIYAHRFVHPINYDGKINFTIHMFFVTLMPPLRAHFPHKIRQVPVCRNETYICDNEIDLLTFLLLSTNYKFCLCNRILFPSCVCEYVTWSRTKLFEIILTLLVFLFPKRHTVQIHKSCKIHHFEWSTEKLFWRQQVLMIF